MRKALRALDSGTPALQTAPFLAPLYFLALQEVDYALGSSISLSSPGLIGTEFGNQDWGTRCANATEVSLF